MGEVYINNITSFFPNEPISNEEMESYLGFVGGNKSRSRAIVLRNNGIKKRYYAIDKNGNHTYSNAKMAALAINKLFENNNSKENIELITSGTSTPDQLLPGHASMVHGYLGITHAEAISFSGACCAAMNAFKYAYLSILSGNTKTAIVTGSEKSSARMLADKFNEETKKLELLENDPMLAFEKEFLRWMLSDGAAAVLLSNKPNSDTISLKVEWVETRSYANEAEACMYAGAEKDKEGILKGWAEVAPTEWLNNSTFAFKQDVKLLDKYIAKLGTEFYLEIQKKRNFTSSDIDWFLPHISSMYFKTKVNEEMIKNNVALPEEKWFINLPQVGNVGSASIFLALEELMKSGRLKKGQKIFLSVPESARFSYAYALLTVC